MATYKQTNTILNSLMSQYRGTSGITATDLTDLIALGQSNISSDDFKTEFGGTLADVIGKTIFRFLKSTLEFPELSRDSYEFGAMLRKIRINPNTMKENTSVKIGDVDYSPNPFAINKPSFDEKFFTGFDTWADKTTIPDVLMNKSFHNAEEMGAFIDAVMSSIGNNFTAHENLMAKTSVVNWIGEKFKNTNGIINLRTLYNAQFSTDITEEECYTNQSFMQFAGMVVRNMKNYLMHDNTIYSVGHKVNNTSEDDMLVYMLGDFVSAYNTYLLNGVSIFNNEMIKLPNYREINTWQAGGNGENVIPTFNSNSSINITTSSGVVESVSGVIGIIADRNGIATTSTDTYVATDRFNGDRYTNYTYGATNQYINDLDEQGVVFTVG